VPATRTSPSTGWSRRLERRATFSCASTARSRGRARAGSVQRFIERGVELKASASAEEFTGHIRAEFEKKAGSRVRPASDPNSEMIYRSRFGCALKAGMRPAESRRMVSRLRRAGPASLLSLPWLLSLASVR